ncbi:MAG: PadR family transcriptional regulator [Dehalococcoidia bacterium]|nr:PadR family transcriptional regulator [Dehalococcoidia bacterium]
MAALTTTSYAILGWLSVRPWTTYELAQQLRRNLRFFWPRVESRIYQETKHLVTEGVAKGERSYVGRRGHTIYSITPKGRRALAVWMRQQNDRPLLEFEGLVKVFFGASATPEQLLAAIQSAKVLADEIQAAGVIVAREYLEGRSAWPDRAPLSGLIFDFLWNHAENLRRWAESSQQEVATWPTSSADKKTERAFQVFRTAIEQDEKRSRG